MSQLEKLKALQSQSNTTNASLTLFNNVVVVNVGVNPTPHFPKLKDKFGNKVKDENGKDKRSETSAGLGYDIKSANMIFIEQKGQIADY